MESEEGKRTHKLFRKRRFFRHLYVFLRICVFVFVNVFHSGGREFGRGIPLAPNWQTTAGRVLSSRKPLRLAAPVQKVSKFISSPATCGNQFNYNKYTNTKTNKYKEKWKPLLLKQLKSSAPTCVRQYNIHIYKQIYKYTNAHTVLTIMASVGRGHEKFN